LHQNSFHTEIRCCKLTETGRSTLYSYKAITLDDRANYTKHINTVCGVPNQTFRILRPGIYRNLALLHTCNSSFPRHFTLCSEREPECMGHGWRCVRQMAVVTMKQSIH